MKKERLLYCLIGIIVTFLFGSRVLAQADYGVAHLEKGNQNTYLNTGVDLNKLIKEGEAGSASFEFWAYNIEKLNWSLTDLMSDPKSLNISMAEDASLNITLNTQNFKVDLSNAVKLEEWYHIALTFHPSGNNTTVSVFLNGNKKGEFDLSLDKDGVRPLFFKKPVGVDMMLTELRAWNQERTSSQLADTWHRSYLLSSPADLSNLEGNGLRVFYGSSDYKDEQLANLPHFTSVKWNNVLKDVEGYGPAKVLTSMDETPIAEITGEVSHPILDNSKIFLKASKGTFLDKIELRWPHIKKAEGYRVYRDQILVKTVTDLSGIEISKDVFYEDKEVIPGKLYSYRVEAFSNSNKSFSSAGYDEGFIFYNGRISGNIKTTGDIFVDSVKLVAIPEKGVMPGNALIFPKNSTSILFTNVDVLRKKDALTFEFWYKANETSAEVNKVFNLGGYDIELSSSVFQFKYKDDVLATTNIENTDAWHHYAVTSSPNSTSLYVDGELVGSETSGFKGIDGATRTFEINKSAAAEYSLDEMRVWNGEKSENLVKADYLHILSGNEENLLLYYRFDMGLNNKVFNLAQDTRGDYYGSWETKDVIQPKWLGVGQQPEQLVYGIYTDSSGNYELDAMNYGSSADGITFNLTPSKPNHKFSPEKKGIKLALSTNSSQYQKSAVDFTDVSALPVSGRVFYRDEETIYPVPKGQSIMLDGQVVLGGDESKTDAAGVYSITAPLGKHRIEVNNQDQLQSFGTYSLKLDGEDDYLMSSEVYSADSATWSGWFMFLEANQDRDSYMFTQGDLSLVIKQTGKMVVMNKGNVILNSVANLSVNDWHFFALSYNKETKKISLLVDNEIASDNNIGEVNTTGNYVIGAKFADGQGTLNFKGNIDQFEIRHAAYNEEQLNELKEGDRIEGDNDNIFAVYPFEEDEGLRTVSWTEDSQNKILDIYGKPVHDSQIFKPYQRKFRYDYVADNKDLPVDKDGVAYSPNILKVITAMNFENKTRFGIVGNIVVPCGCGVGEWTGKVTRTDLQGDKFEKIITEDNFNSDFSVFSVDGLMPGQYKIELSLVDQPSTKLQSQIIDLRSGWTSYNFKYENPIVLTAEVIRKVTVSDDFKETYDKNVEQCDDNYILEKANYYDIKVSAYEVYGEKKCYLENFKYTIDGDLGRVAPKNMNDKEGEYVMPEGGIDTIRMLTAGPNFNAPYTRSFAVSANKNGTTAETNITAVVTGVKQFNQDFTLDPPDEMIMVLHDPPGDQSSLSWAKGSKFSYSTHWSFDGGVKVKVDVASGVDAHLYAGTWAGFIGGAVVMQRVNVSQAEGVFNTTQNIGAGGGGTESNTVSLDQVLSTDDKGIIKGIDGDVYVGSSYVITMGEGKELTMDGCTPKVTEQIVATPQLKSMFAHTHQHIESVLIPNLERLEQQAKNDKDEKLAGEYAEKISKWKDLLTKNAKKYDDIDNFKSMVFSNNAGDKSIENTYNFSAGTSTSWTLGRSSSTSGDIYEFYSGDVVTDFASKFNAFGADITMKTGVTAYWNQKFNYNTGKAETESFTMRFADDDIGDQFDVIIKQDPEFGSPIFKTRSGRSMAPFEQGTVPREAVELVSDKYTAYAEPGERAVFNLTMRNTSPIDDGVPKDYDIVVPSESYPTGLIARLNEAWLTGPKAYKFNYGQNIDAILTFEQNGLTNDTVFEHIPVVFYSHKEVASGSYVFTKKYLDEINMKVVDTIYLNVEFHQACVNEIKVDEPQDNWVVNNTSDDKLNLRFKFDRSSESFTKLLVEYTEGADNKPNLLKEITPEELEASLDKENYYNIPLDVSGLADGAYRVRLTPMCGLGNDGWRKQNPTPWISGNIFRVSPVITQTHPENNGMYTEGIISANIDREVLGDAISSLNVSLRGVLSGMDYEPVAAVFKTVNDSIVVPSFDAMKLDKAFSAEFWIYPEKYPSSSVPILKKGDNNLNISLTKNGAIDNSRAVSTPLTPFKWSHVAVVYDGSHLMRTFIDGALVSEETNVDFFKSNDEPLVIVGKNGNDGFIGRLDEVRIWSKALTQEEIITNRKSMLTGNEEGLAAYFPLENNALEGEAVRDYTGRAQGTTANGLTFTKEKNEAAPIDVENVVQDVPIDVVLSEGNKIILQPKSSFNPYYLEGALLTANIQGDKIRDVYGNKLQGISWSFRVNKNALEWSKANLDKVQPQGQSTGFDATLSNVKGANSIKFTIFDLPSWLEADGDYSASQEYELGPGYEAKVHFRIAPWLNPGEHTTFVKAKTDSGIETFKLKVNVESAKPSYNFNPKDYAYQMNMTAQLVINGEMSADKNDLVGVYVGNQVRGFGSVKHIESVDKYVVQLQVYSNKASGENLSFRIWDASDSKEYLGIEESYSFSSDAIIGTLSKPVTMTTGSSLVKRLPFNKGFYWMTFALHSPDQSTLSIDNLQGFGSGDTIENKEGKIATYDGSNWSGDLKTIVPEQSYQVGLNDNRVIEVVGEGVNYDVDIALSSDKSNWIGYLPENMMMTSEALKSVSSKTAENGDVVSGREGFAEFVDGSWVGSLTHLVPGLGYRLQVAQNGVLNYFGISKADREAAGGGNVKSSGVVDYIARDVEKPLTSVKTEAYNMGFDLKPEAYSHFMHIEGVVEGDPFISEHPQLVLAYINGVPAGVATPQKIDNKWFYYMSVYSNSPKEVEFRLIDRQTSRAYQIDGDLDFVDGHVEGSNSHPYEFKLGEQLAPENGYDTELYQNTPNPYHDITIIGYDVNVDGPVKVILNDMLGQSYGYIVDEVQSAGYHTVTLNRSVNGKNLPEGMYFYTLITKDGKITRKMIVR
ncbi:MAG: LamG-like jellyroll fold domain-containing protein [Hyphomicrobiales bacterium]